MSVRQNNSAPLKIKTVDNQYEIKFSTTKITNEH